MKVLVLTTSYPRDPSDVAGRFVADEVEAARAGGISVEVVSPAGFRHFGIAYGHGVVGNLRARPWLALLLPVFIWNFRRAAARAARDVDLVHAHWLPSGVIAATLGKPFVVQVWGTDVELARRVPFLARVTLRRARRVVAASSFLAERACALGAEDVAIVPIPVAVPESVAAPVEPPHVLYVGRLSEEKGIREFARATEGLPRVVVGDGPLRALVPDARGFVPPSELGAYYERCAVVCAPSHREGYGAAVREAMAYGRPVVATATGGLVDAVADGENGLLVPVGDVAALRSAVVRLLEDPTLRRALGDAARARAVREFGGAAAAGTLGAVYADALRRGDGPREP